MRVVIDTNVLMSGIFWGGMPGKVLEAWSLGHFENVLSVEIIEEYLRVLKNLQKKYPESKEFGQSVVESFTSTALVVEVPSSSKIKISRDQDDDIFILAALAGQAKFVITGDKDLLDLKQYDRVKIIKPADFLKMI